MMSPPPSPGTAKEAWPGRVALGVDDGDAGDDLLAGLHQHDLLLGRAQVLLRAESDRPHLLGQFAGRVGMRPEVPFGLGDVMRGIGEGQCAAIGGGAEEVIGMGMGDRPPW